MLTTGLKRQNTGTARRKPPIPEASAPQACPLSQSNIPGASVQGALRSTRKMRHNKKHSPFTPETVMSIPFEFYTNPNPDPQAPKRYHPRVVAKGTVSLKEIVETVSGRCTLSAADLHAAVTAIEQVVSENLANGYRVRLDGLGSFSLTLSSPEVDDPTKVRAQNVNVKSVVFSPDKSFVAHSQKQGFERSADKPHSAAVSIDQIKEGISEYLKTNQFVRRADIERLLGLTKSTAQRTVKTLLSTGFLKNISGDEHHPLYALA